MRFCLDGRGRYGRVEGLYAGLCRNDHYIVGLSQGVGGFPAPVAVPGRSACHILLFLPLRIALAGCLRSGRCEITPPSPSPAGRFLT